MSDDNAPQEIIVSLAQGKAKHLQEARDAYLTFAESFVIRYELEHGKPPSQGRSFSEWAESLGIEVSQDGIFGLKSRDLMNESRKKNSNLREALTTWPELAGTVKLNLTEVIAQMIWRLHKKDCSPEVTPAGHLKIDPETSNLLVCKSIVIREVSVVQPVATRPAASDTNKSRPKSAIEAQLAELGTLLRTNMISQLEHDALRRKVLGI